RPVGLPLAHRPPRRPPPHHPRPLPPPPIPPPPLATGRISSHRKESTRGVLVRGEERRTPRELRDKPTTQTKTNARSEKHQGWLCEPCSRNSPALIVGTPEPAPKLNRSGRTRGRQGWGGPGHPV